MTRARSARARLQEFAGAEPGVLGYQRIDYSPQRVRAFVRLLAAYRREVLAEAAERAEKSFKRVDNATKYSYVDERGRYWLPAGPLCKAIRTAITKGGPRGK